ncbi:putative Lipid A biosynthesis lauroyl acyltransferase [uncultured Desulfobacterium sp.]|uniref:Putative Lipid A biosynthesis lauroyl acyltransferase n=1 Tax=uncultured Desulfobacterium sp. TaxID=201089 RepID=A0A445MWV5_9BACT|nr:putative Lipid A biosynthesis lauroyl acyltransferase [uncultured Desulfobacterium sp.]
MGNNTRHVGKALRMTVKKGTKQIRRWLIYVIVCLIVKLLRAIPRRFAIAIMRGIGRAAYLLIGSRRKRMINHLTMAFGNEKSLSEIKRISKEVFLNIGIFAADAIRLPQIVGNGMEDIVTVEGCDRLDQVLANGKPAILLTAHLGNWELMAAWFAQKGYKVKVIGAPNHNPWIDRLIVQTRNEAGYTSITRKTNTREILDGIRNGYSMGILIDQDTKVEGVFVKFFNQWAHTAVGPVVLARKYGLSIIPIFIRLNGQFTYHIEVQEPIDLNFTDNKDHDLVINTQKISDIYERIIRRFPEQWVWMHRRWKKQPQAVN